MRCDKRGCDKRAVRYIATYRNVLGIPKADLMSGRVTALCSKHSKGIKTNKKIK